MKTTNSRINCLKELILLEERRADLNSQITLIDERVAALQGNLSAFAFSAPGIPVLPKAKGSRFNTAEIASPLRHPSRASLAMDLNLASNAKATPAQARFSQADSNSLAGTSGNGIATERPSLRGSKGVHRRGKIPAKRGELKDRILGELRQAGSEGITIKELSSRLDAKYKNIYIWFVTTGKRIAGIRKAGPARYKLEVA